MVTLFNVRVTVMRFSTHSSEARLSFQNIGLHNTCRHLQLSGLAVRTARAVTYPDCQSDTPLSGTASQTGPGLLTSDL